MAVSISLKDIKPHEGAGWRAFEEMCFQLFAAEFGNEGDVVRREGAGGDGGLEGYVCDINDNETIGLQAKFFDQNLVQAQWNQVDNAVTTALRGNADAKSLELYIIAVPRNLTKTQRATWTRKKKSWSSLAKALGFSKSPKFELWDESKLRHLLLKSDNRGQLLYWFDFPNLDRARCCQLTEASISGLGDRYIEQFHQGLHARTHCEEGIHRFLRTERFRREFHHQGRSFLREICNAPWRNKNDWSAATKAEARSANRELDKVVHQLRDGISLPSEINRLASSAKKCADSINALRSARLTEFEAESKAATKPTNAAFNQPDTPHRRCRDEFSDRDLTAWYYWLSGTASIADAQFLLVTGDVGMGKSHLLAETCRRFNEAGGAALFIEGAKFGTNEFPWIQLMQWADVPTSVRDFLNAYSGLAATTPLCGLICIDAVNETPNREVWLNHLHSFAEELRPFPNIKLIVSCRSDFLELSVPEAIRRGEASRWHALRHQGLNASVGEAVQNYLKAYNVQGGSAQLYSDEFRRPLMLKIFCEAFEGRRVPQGTLSLEDVLAKYVDRKCRSICDRIGCKPTVAKSALRSIAQTMASATSTTLTETETRKILHDHHSLSTEDKSLYRALLSEGVVLETMIRAADGLGFECYIRFSYERIWDYFVSLVFLPRHSKPSSALLERLGDKDWQSRNRGLLSMFAIRLAEDSQGELHDLLAVDPKGPNAVYLNAAFLDSLEWRSGASCTRRTEELFRILAPSRGEEFIFSFATHEDHPWNAEHLHNRLMPMPLGERDRRWTRWVNDQFDNEPHREDDDGELERLLKIAEGPAVSLFPDKQITLCAIALAWLLPTTYGEKRIRVTLALANLLRGKLDVAVQLVTRFARVNDPYILESVLYAAASTAMHSLHADHHLGQLAKVVHEAIFAGTTLTPHLLIRHYASLVCQEAERKSVLPNCIPMKSFRPPFRSRWPKIMSKRKLESLEARVKEDWENHRGLSKVLDSTKTQSDGCYGDFGRYELESAVHDFQRQRRDRPRLNGSSYGTHFDARIARRYVVQRVLESGLDLSEPDHSSIKSSNTRGRPAIERLGKKYQWIAYYELLGYLSDHFHLEIDRGHPDGVFRSASDLNPPDLLDPFRTDTVRNDEDEFGWEFVPPSTPWWQPYANPLTRPMTASQREAFLLKDVVFEPKSLLRACGPNKQEWIALDGRVEFYEPVASFARKGADGCEQTCLYWSFNSYAIPKRLVSAMAGTMSSPRFEDHSMCPDSPSYRAQLRDLQTYPKDLDRLAIECEKVWGLDVGAWFTTCNYDNGYEHATQVKGTIPSPQLAELMRLRWTRNAMEFSTKKTDDVVFQNLGPRDDSFCVVRADKLLSALTKANLELVWRIYGWKWSTSRGQRDYPQREYWVLYRLSSVGKIDCIGGGTWIVEPDPTPKPLPWTTQRLER